ncbi:MAG: hypothetical protein JXC33_06480 [Deltaproteobacteria bacterium]|nr:hypothetical protein [Deltaproteobacteria bacterium]
MRAFIKLRQLIADNKELSGRLARLERHVADHDEQIIEMVKAIRQLMKPALPPKRRRIGFYSD